jgi:hypothetical protein
VPPAMNSIHSSGCSNDHTTLVCPAKLQISSSPTEPTTYSTLRKPYGANYLISTSSYIFNRFSRLKFIISASQLVQTTIFYRVDNELVMLDFVQ